MAIVIQMMNRVFHFIFLPLEQLAPLWGLILISLLMGIFMRVIFRFTSNQKAIKRSKDKAKAYILEVVLYKDNRWVTIEALFQILRYNFVYLKFMLVPFLIIFIPMMIVLIQMNFRYEYRPFQPDESVIVKLRLKDNADFDPAEVSVQSSEAIALETPVLRIQDEHEFDWRMRIKAPGIHDLKFQVGNESITKSINALPDFQMLSPRKVARNFWSMLLFPAENPLPGDSKVAFIEILYPTRQFFLFHREIHWLVVFFVFSIISAFALKGVLKVEI